MLTPQEVAEHAFSKASFGGYNMAMVDEFLDLVTADYTSLYKENATLKAKMKVLADKVEEYRATEEAMRKAMLSAQKTADELVKEAEDRAAAIVGDAEREAKDKIAAIRQEVESEHLRLTAAQNATAAYIAKLKDLYQNEMEYLSSLSKLSASVKVDPIAQTAEAISSAVEKAVEEVPSVEDPAVQAEDEDREPTIPMGGKRGEEKPEEKKEEPAVPPLEEDSLYQALRRGAGHQEPPAEEPGDAAEAPKPDSVGAAAHSGPPSEEEEPTRRIDFSHLKFGKDYEIS